MSEFTYVFPFYFDLTLLSCCVLPIIWVTSVWKRRKTCSKLNFLRNMTSDFNNLYRIPLLGDFIIFYPTLKHNLLCYLSVNLVFYSFFTSEIESIFLWVNDNLTWPMFGKWYFKYSPVILGLLWQMKTEWQSFFKLENLIIHQLQL